MLSSEFFIPREGTDHAQNFRRVRILPCYSFPHIKDFDLNLHDNSKKVFYHLDLDAFFAQVEERDNPSLRGKPVSVGGVEDSNIGIVMTANYVARARGVKTGVSVVDAKKLCPDLISLPCNGPKYERTLLDVVTILHNYFPPDCVEKYSVDECFMEGTGVTRTFDEAIALGRTIKDEIKKNLGLHISLGVSYNKSYAKTASKMEKPDGLTPIPFEKTKKHLELLNKPADKLWGIGRRIYRRLLAMGIITIGDLANSNESRMRKEFGINGIVFRKCARGEDTSGIFVKTEKEKCLGHSHTVYEPITDPNKVYREIRYLTEYVCRKMRMKVLVTGDIVFSIRYDNLHYMGSEFRFPQHTNSDNEVYEAALSIFNSLPQPNEFRKIRTFSIFAVDLHHDTKERNLHLFEKELRIPYYEIDKLKSRFGEKIIRVGLSS